MKVSNISLEPVEFLWKLVVVLTLVVPTCIGGIVFLSLFLMDFHVKTWIEIITVVLAAGLGTCLSFGLTMGVIKIGHKEVSNG